MLFVFTIGWILPIFIIMNGVIADNYHDQEAKLSAFTVKQSDALYVPTGDSIIQFNSVRTDVGNNFKPEPGIYTAPTNGTYVFSLAAVSSDGVELGMFRNGVELEEVDSVLKTTPVVTELIEGDIVYVKVKLAPENATLSSCKFSGFQLTEKTCINTCTC